MIAATPAFDETAFRAFVDAHLDQELLRFITCGSVDDGKSTLIGRLLHDTKSIYEDQLAAVAASRVNRAGNGQVDLSLLTDGLRAEREQGITIDVAYRYFSTARRKFIIADTPGHEQYTRNMATGASTADVAVVLLDARAFLRNHAGAGGLLPQSRRHSTIASLLRIPHVVAAVNKMDLVGYDQATFDRIAAEFQAWCTHLGLGDVRCIPVSALAGDNIVEPSAAMRWYTGPTLLEYLETVPLTFARTDAPLRFPVQLVNRPDATFRGFAGRVESGVLSPGQAVRALPSGRTSTVKRIVTWNGDLRHATAPQSVTVELAEEIDLSRGEMLVAADAPAPLAATSFRADVVWMHEEPLTPGRTYLLKHTTRTVRATAARILHRLDINTGEHGPADALAMNDIGEVAFATNLPLWAEPYAANRTLGSAILIDPLSNATLGAVMILDTSAAGASPGKAAPAPGAPEMLGAPQMPGAPEMLGAPQMPGAPEMLGAPLIGQSFRPMRGPHEPGLAAPPPSLVYLPGQAAQAAELLAAYAAAGVRAISLDDPAISPGSLPSVLRALQLAAVTAVATRTDIPASALDAVRTARAFHVIEDLDAAFAWLREGRGPTQ